MRPADLMPRRQLNIGKAEPPVIEKFSINLCSINLEKICIFLKKIIQIEVGLLLKIISPTLLSEAKEPFSYLSPTIKMAFI